MHTPTFGYDQPQLVYNKNTFKKTRVRAEQKADSSLKFCSIIKFLLLSY